MTVLGPLRVEEMGVTDSHDHLHLQSPMLIGDEIDDRAAITAEVRDGAASGLRTIVELTPIGLGRRPDVLRDVSTATGVHIVAATGFHRDAHYPQGHWVLTATDDDLLARMTTDLAKGMDQTSARAGVIKAGASLNEISANERRRLIAAAAAAKAAGVAVVVHTEEATCGPEIIELLTAEDLPVDQIVLAHVDRNPDPALHLDLLARGVLLVYDTIGRAKYFPDSVRIELIEAVCVAGRGNQILLGLDLGRASYLHVNGGWGLRHLMGDFVPKLQERIGDLLVDSMLIRNPASAFALRTPAAA